MELLDTPVAEVMTREVIAIDPDLNAKVALDTMMDRGIHILPVAKGGTGLMGGIVTRHHIQRTLALLEQETDRLGRVPTKPIREVMVYFVFKIKPDATVREAIRLMNKEHVRALPVVDLGQCVGILTRGDILRFAAGI